MSSGREPGALSMLPVTMKAVLLRGHGDFEQLDLRDDVPVPQPAAGEVLLQVLAAAVNNTDINTRIGWYSRSVTGDTASASGQARASADDGGWTGSAFVFPRIQGTDVCGRVVAVGAGVDPGRIGGRVLVDPVLRSRSGSPAQAGFLGADRDGGFAEFVTVPAVNAHVVTTTLSDAELATFPCSYSAAENMIDRAEVRAGQTVLVTGASGGVGSAAVQLAVRRGATVVALAHPSKASDLEALGARRVLPRDADLLAALGSESVDVVVDAVGGAQFPAFLAVLQRGGSYAVAGAIAGPLVELDLRTLYLKDLRLLGCTVTPPHVFENLVRYVERGEIRPLVSATYPLAQIVAAQAAFLKKAHTGKIVLLP
ncbi:MAG TPA: alcohol dehydrogenase family protein [Steroidobacteraceae bacterium]